MQLGTREYIKLIIDWNPTTIGKEWTTYHPSTNGEVENRNKEIIKYLKLLAKQEDDWNEVLPSALWALRTCKNEKTKFSSFELLYGRQDLQPLELTLNKDGRMNMKVRKNIGSRSL